MVNRKMAKVQIPVSSANRLPLEEMIDSDEAVGIALDNGVDTTAVVEKIRTNTYDGAVGKAIPVKRQLEDFVGHSYVEPLLHQAESGEVTNWDNEA